MSNGYFQFRQFLVRQDRCAMKVGTDGTLLGAWAAMGSRRRDDDSEEPPRVLDIGTGTGLLALMMAQRHAEAMVVGIDIDAEAVAQARENVAASPFARRVSIVQGDFRSSAWGADVGCGRFDAIVCNPPYFDQSLESPDERRTSARHTSALSYRQLMVGAASLLADEGELSVVIPDECRGKLEAEATLAGLSLWRECGVRTTPRKAVRRWLLAFRRHSAVAGVERAVEVLEDAPGHRSAWYRQLTAEFYL